MKSLDRAAHTRHKPDEFEGRNMKYAYIQPKGKKGSQDKKTTTQLQGKKKKIRIPYKMKKDTAEAEKQIGNQKKKKNHGGFNRQVRKSKEQNSNS